MTFPSRLRAARRRAGIQQNQLAAALGISPSAYCGYETGKREPDLAKVAAIAALLETSVDALLGMPAAPVREVSDEEYALVRVRRRLDAHGRRLLDLVAREELRRLMPALVPLRISEQPAAAGFGVDLGEDAFREAYVPSDRLPRGAAFGVPVRGDSMEPRFHDGDVLLVSPTPPAAGEVGVFILDGAGYVKVAGQGELISLNPAYAPIPMNETIRAAGRVIGTLSPEEVFADPA